MNFMNLALFVFDETEPKVLMCWRQKRRLSHKKGMWNPQQKNP